jgi:hypothetical protein
MRIGISYLSRTSRDPGLLLREVVQEPGLDGVEVVRGCRDELLQPGRRDAGSRFSDVLFI